MVSYGKKSVSLYIPMFELLKEVMWSEMDIHHVDKNRKNEKNIDVCIHYDKKDSRRDIYW